MININHKKQQLFQCVVYLYKEINQIYNAQRFSDDSFLFYFFSNFKTQMIVWYFLHKEMEEIIEPEFKEELQLIHDIATSIDHQVNLYLQLPKRNNKFFNHTLEINQLLHIIKFSKMFAPVPSSNISITQKTIL